MAEAEAGPEAGTGAGPEAGQADTATKPKVAEEAAAEAPVETPVEPAKPQRAAPEPPKHYFWGTGRRKKSVARVRIRPGTGKIAINKRDMEEYFTADKDRSSVLAPLEAAEMLKAWDIWVNVRGGGFTGQAGAVKLGLARAIAGAVPDMERALRHQGLLTRDPRMSERKKPGQKGARKRFQFSKR